MNHPKFSNKRVWDFLFLFLFPKNENKKPEFSNKKIRVD
jgi:hypothetical protein